MEALSRLGVDKDGLYALYYNRTLDRFMRMTVVGILQSYVGDLDFVVSLKPREQSSH